VLTPLLVIHRCTIDDAVWEEGWRDGADLVLRQNDTRYVTQDIFDDDIENVFIERVKSVRRKIRSPTATAVLLCDKCSAHLNERTLRRLVQANIRMITLPPHTSNLFQPLDLVSFRIFKQKKGTVVFELPRGSQSYQIPKVVPALELATVSKSNRTAVKRGGLVANLQIVPPMALVQRDQLLGRIEQSTLLDLLEGDCWQFPHFGFFNRDYFRGTETAKFVLVLGFVYLCRSPSCG
jgi:hypothetical protein